MKIYTKTGDKGKTALFGGKRVSKADLRVEAYGCVDELNSVIGIAIAEISNIKYQQSNIKEELINIQNDLFNIGSLLASSIFNSKLSAINYLEYRVDNLERLIDNLNKDLPKLQNFILPGGGEVGSQLHFARTVCRRVERRVAELSKKQEVGSVIPVYLNRLSDLLFVMARFINNKENKKEIVWPGK